MKIYIINENYLKDNRLRILIYCNIFKIMCLQDNLFTMSYVNLTI
jgi:hypothetical protein